MVHGYSAKWIGVYNRYSQPTFSVGEYDWGNQNQSRGWIWATATDPNGTGRLRTASSVFDFKTKDSLKQHGQYASWYGYGLGVGLVGDNTDAIEWKNRAVTFLKNHDTGYRTEEDGKPEKDHECEEFHGGREVQQGYAYILTHPGVPTVAWQHYFDWGNDLREKIKALINARKVAGVHAGSALHTQDNAKQRNVYAARVMGRKGDLYVRIGGDDDSWQPSHSGYRDYQEYAQGEGWKVWVALPGNPAIQQATFNEKLPIPTYRDPDSISIPDEWVRE